MSLANTNTQNTENSNSKKFSPVDSQIITLLAFVLFPPLGAIVGWYLNSFPKPIYWLLCLIFLVVLPIIVVVFSSFKYLYPFTTYGTSDGIVSGIAWEG
jgi:uncharacterized membrane protein